MLSYNISTLKAHLSGALRKVRGGETALILDRKQIVAKITRAEAQDLIGDSDEHLRELVRRGVVTVPSRLSGKRRPAVKPVKTAKRVSVVAEVLKEREDSW